MIITHKFLIDKLKSLGMVSEDGKPVLYSTFKNRASVHRYGRHLKIVYLGIPKENLFGFYVFYNTDAIVMKDAYKMLLKLVKGDMEDFDNEDLQWGNCGIPLVYGRMRKSFDESNLDA